MGGVGKKTKKIHARENAKKKKFVQRRRKRKKFMQKEGPIVTFIKYIKFANVYKNSCGLMSQRGQRGRRG